MGDSTNDGLREQFELFEECINEVAPEKIFFPVIGNHDVLHAVASEGCENYAEFQRHLLTNAESRGLSISYDKNSLAYYVQIENIYIIGLRCVISGRKYSFPEGKQILWLNERLQQKSSRHLILCHAPLLAHNPNRNTGNPYLGKNKMLQEVIDNHENVIFLSGHTHMSPNTQAGNLDNVRKNIYLDCGSVVDTDITKEKGMMSNDWNDGCITNITIEENKIEICMSSIKTGIKFPRGYYCLYLCH